MKIISDTQQKIIDAYLQVAENTELHEPVNMTRVAKMAGISTQAIYKKHFRSVADITTTLKESIVSEIIDAMNKRLDFFPNASPLMIIADEAFPILYNHRRSVRIFFNHTMGTDWLVYLGDTFTSWIEPFLSPKNLPEEFSIEEFAKINMRLLLNIILHWIADRDALPPSLFKAKFLKLCDLFAISNYLVAKN
ncbi:MAG: TetR/AcrR family transcriptional regulator [Streptococcaceae bacterium]|jgi:DNA-binding phage protein|nr:TetR/AcrR family transcriptional regulator [Streptococcaceae bacterium]